MEQSIALTIPHKPVSASRPRVFRNGGRAYAKGYTAYRKYLADFLPQHRPPDPLLGPLVVCCTFVHARPKKSGYAAPAGDLDNCAKAVWDALQAAGFFADDRLIVESRLSKRWAEPGELPHTAVMIDCN